MHGCQNVLSTSDITDYLYYGFVATIPQWKEKMYGITGIIKAHSGSPLLILTIK